MIVLFTIIALNVDHTTQLRGGTGCRATPAAIAFQVGIMRSFVLAVFLQTGHRRVVSRELAETVPVNSMSTWHFVTGRTRREQVFSLQTGQLRLVLAVLTVVIVVRGCDRCTCRNHDSV
jgi:hypothetical protein